MFRKPPGFAKGTAKNKYGMAISNKSFTVHKV